MPSQEIRLSTQQRRAALQVLDRNQLSQLTEQLGLEVGDRRVIDNHINALLPKLLSGEIRLKDAEQAGAAL
jgi:hypothetical protein